MPKVGYFLPVADIPLCWKLCLGPQYPICVGHIHFGGILKMSRQHACGYASAIRVFRQTHQAAKQSSVYCMFTFIKRSILGALYHLKYINLNADRFRTEQFVSCYKFLINSLRVMSDEPSRRHSRSFPWSCLGFSSLWVWACHSICARGLPWRISFSKQDQVFHKTEHHRSFFDLSQEAVLKFSKQRPVTV